MNNALTPNSTFTQWILNYVYNSATAAFIDIYENTYCNGILIVKNELTLNSKLNQKILNLLYDSATAAYICTFMGTPVAIRYLTVLLLHISTFMGIPFAMEP